MQDRFIGDVRDFAKYGLLRRLCGPEGPRLGVVWYRTDAEEVGGGGGNIDCYFHPEAAGCHEHEFCDSLRACDPELAEALRPIRRSPDRTVLDVEGANILLDDPRFFHEFWTFQGCQEHAERRRRREATFRRALNGVRDCDLVFLDPDIGIDPAGIHAFSAQVPLLQHVQWREARGFYENSKRSLILIQFLIPFPAAMTRGEQIRDRKKNLCDALEGINEQDIRTLLFCFRGCSGSTQPNPKNGPPLLFFIVPRKGHDEFIDARLRVLVDDESPWSRFFSLGGGDRPRGGCPDPRGPCDACDA